MNTEAGQNQGTSRTQVHSKQLLGVDWFGYELLKPSKYPPNFIPRGATPVIGIDQGSPDGDCTCRGFYKDGVFHVQEVKHND